MVCPDEFTWSMYADGELPENETSQLRQHSTECQACRAVAAALAEENRALVHAFQHLDLAASIPEAAAAVKTRRLAVELGAFVCIASLITRIAIDAVTGAPVPVAAEWLNPFRLAGQLNLLATSIVYLLEEGGPMLMSTINVLGFISIITLILFAAPKLLRRSIAAGVLLGALVLSFTFSTPASAIDIRSGGADQRGIVVASGETVDDTVVATGESVIIEGTITGDLIAAARRVVVRGKVQGDLISFAQTIDIDGVVDGNVYGWAQKVQLRGQLTRNLYGFAQDITADKRSEIGGNATGFAQQVTIDGKVGRDAVAFAQLVDITGNVARNTFANAESIRVLSPARIGGNLVAGIPKTENLKVEDGAAIGGKTDIRIRPVEPSRYSTVGFYVRQVLWLAAAFIAGLVLFWLFPTLRTPNLNSRNALLMAGIVGFLVAVAIPVAAIFVGITIIGLPLALVSFGVWMLGLYLAKIVVAAFIGRALLPSEQSSLGIVLLAGLVLVLIAVNLPYVGGLVNLILTLIGFGALLIAAYHSRRPAVL
jgi:cytoskeletal protein CcmA (bactofilin family)